MQPMTQRFTIELRRLQRDSHDQCSLCGKPFREANTAHAGYSNDGSPIYVGDCCQSRISETAARFYWKPREFDVPIGNASLWRYMDFAKFVGLLKDRQLYFSRADCLGDRFEGAKGVIPNKAKWDEHYLKFFRDAIRNPPPGNKCNFTDEEVELQAQRLLREMADSGQTELRTTYVSCWHESNVESEALWRLYCPPPSPGIAIRTTYSALNMSLGDDPDISIGRVRYIDFQKGFAGVSGAIFRKRESLSHEREVRAVIHDFSDRDTLGKLRPIDLGQLIVAVIVSPFAPTWFDAILRETMSRFGVAVCTVSSELLLEPFF